MNFGEYGYDTQPQQTTSSSINNTSTHTIAKHFLLNSDFTNNPNTMSYSMDNYPFECEFCNYESNSKSEKLWKMTQRLHKKKCKKTGRTEAGLVVADVRNKMRQFQLLHPNQATFLPQGKKASLLNQGGLGGEIRNIDLYAKERAEAQRQKVKAYAEEEEGERGESPDSACECGEPLCGTDSDNALCMWRCFGKEFMTWVGEQESEVAVKAMKDAVAKYKAGE